MKKKTYNELYYFTPNNCKICNAWTEYDYCKHCMQFHKDMNFPFAVFKFVMTFVLSIFIYSLFIS